MAKEFKLAKAKADELLASKSEEKAFTYDEQNKIVNLYHQAGRRRHLPVHHCHDAVLPAARHDAEGGRPDARTFRHLSALPHVQGKQGTGLS